MHDEHGYSTDQQWVGLRVMLIRQETLKAFQCFMSVMKLEWIPKCQIKQPNLYKPGDRDVVIYITEWLAEQRQMRQHGNDD